MTDRAREEHIKKTLEKIHSIENAINRPFYNTETQQQVQINIRIDNHVPHGLFKPDPKLEGGWIASEQTYRAMKKDIFALDEEMIDLQESYQCQSCKTDLDKQFWEFCPYCGASFLY